VAAVSYARGITRQTVSALRHVFQSGDYEDPFYEDLYVGTQYSMEQGSFPMIVVSWRPQRVQNSGLGFSAQLEDPNTGQTNTYYKWRSQGQIVINALALNPYERDTLVDNLIEVIGLGDTADQSAAESRFFAQLTDSDFIDLTPNTQDLQVSDMGTATRARATWPRSPRWTCTRTATTSPSRPARTRRGSRKALPEVRPGQADGGVRQEQVQGRRPPALLQALLGRGQPPEARETERETTHGSLRRRSGNG
jgi:hypothetical protein